MYGSLRYNTEHARQPNAAHNEGKCAQLMQCVGETTLPWRQMREHTISCYLTNVLEALWTEHDDSPCYGDTAHA
eukprot:6193034-Pleurochrysis_carterae.AAC.3